MRRKTYLFLGMISCFLGCSSSEELTATITGSVTSMNGQPQPLVIIAARSASNNEATTAKTDSSGHYFFRETFLPGEIYTLTFSLNGYQNYIHTETLAAGVNVVDARLTPTHCVDGIRSGDEVNVDCGGSCPQVCNSRPELDAGTSIISDAGQSEDTGDQTPIVDAGQSEDTGDQTPIVDAGQPEDTGDQTPIVDAGQPEDTGDQTPVVDAGQPEDAGEPVDSGPEDIGVPSPYTWRDISPPFPSPPFHVNNTLVYDNSRNESILLFSRISSLEAWGWNGSSWRNIPQPSTRPSFRNNHAAVFDSSRGRLVLFGGYEFDVEDREDISVFDTWEWDGSSWTNVTPALPLPSPGIVYPSMSYDSHRQRVVLVGWKELSADQMETWEWDGSTWTDVTPEQSPPWRIDGKIAYDARSQKTVLFGGYRSRFNAEDTYLLDTWTWDGTSWVDDTPSTGSPGPRRHHAMAYDSSREVIILFGGRDDNDTSLNDTWLWDGVQWQELNPNTPPDFPASISGHGMAFDVARNRMVIFVASTWELEYTQP